MIILVNGPPRCGKDTFINIAKKNLSSSVAYATGKILKDVVKAIYNLDHHTIKLLEECKEDKAPQLGGYSYRQAQIDVFHWLEERHGPDVLVTLSKKAIQGLIARYILIDVGRQAEADAYQQEFGYTNTCLVTIERPNCTFEGDSREEVKRPLPGGFIHQSHINNQYDLEMYELQCLRVLKKWEFINE